VTRGLKAAFTAASRPLSRALLGPCRALNATRGWRVPIFAYHQVAESGARDGYPWTVTPAAFEAQMRTLADEGCPVVSLEMFLRAREAGRLVPGSVVLTFDDGFRGVWLHASPVLKRYGFTATLFLASGLVGAAEFPWIRPWLGRGADAEEWRPLSWDEVREMVGPTLDLGSHTVSHPHLGRLVPAEMAREVAESRRQIQAETGIDVRCLAYPGGIARYGDHSDETRRVVRAAGYTCAVVSEMGRNGVSADPYRLRRFGVGVEDTPALFRAKALGAYTWARGMQWAAQRLLSDSSNY
jgi:peptidoglycan/xylan/chitin deacetylase (PgdA/CDA1 family)